VVKRLQVGLAALALVVAPTLGEDVSAPVGVTVGVPEGFRYRADLKPKPTTVLAFQAKSGEAAILINSIKTSGIGSLDELAKSAQEELGREVTFVTVPAGRLFRFDLEFKDGDPPQSFRERIYMTLHDGRVFQFVLHDEATAFEGHLDSFDAMVAGVRLGQVAQQPPSDPVEPPPADDPPMDPVEPPPADPPSDPVAPPPADDPPTDPVEPPPADAPPPGPAPPPRSRRPWGRGPAASAQAADSSRPWWNCFRAGRVNRGSWRRAGNAGEAVDPVRPFACRQGTRGAAPARDELHHGVPGARAGRRQGGSGARG